MLASIIDKRKYLHDGDVLEARRSRTSQNSPFPSNYVLTCDKTNTIKKYWNPISINAPNKNERLCKSTKVFYYFDCTKEICKTIKDSFNHYGITVPIQTSK